MPKNNISDEYFLSAPDKMVEYLEREGLGYVARAENSFYFLRENIRKFVFLLLSGAGASTLLFLKYVAESGLFCSGFIICAIGWLLCGGYMAIRGLRPVERPMAWTSPATLYEQGWELGELRRRKLYEYHLAGRVSQRLNRYLSGIYDRGILASLFTTGLGLVASIPYFFL